MSAELSVVMAAYNEKVAIAAAIADVVTHVLPFAQNAEIIVVNDGSCDRTGFILDALATSDPRLRVIHQANAGHGPALIAGLNAATGETILILDSDRQILLDDFSTLWTLYRKSDAVLGIRIARRDPMVRRAVSRGMRLLAACLFGAVPQDPNVPFKIVPRDAWNAARPAIGSMNVIPSALLGIHIGISGLRIGERAVVHQPRQGSVSSLRGLKLARFCLAAALALLRFRFSGALRQRMVAGAVSGRDPGSRHTGWR